MLLDNIFSTAYAATQSAQHASPQGGLMSMLPMLILIAFVFYFLMVRPQQKRAKAQKSLMSNLKVGDEIVTIGGIMGRLKSIDDNAIALEIAKDQVISMRKSAIDSILPKGTVGLEANAKSKPKAKSKSKSKAATETHSDTESEASASADSRDGE